MNTQQLKGPEGDSQYVNLKFLASGGMGDIYTSLDTALNKEVAVKIIRINNNQDKELLEEEFKIATNLRHENIIRTFFYGQFSDNSGDYFYSIMEICKKGNLETLLNSSKNPFDLQDCIVKFEQLLKGLKEAHKTIIHRDLKPSNILIDENGVLKISDFGISKYVDNLTRTKTFKGYGSFPYMSPECWLSETNSAQMDIYSLGLIFFEILTLQKAFNGPRENDFKDQHLFHLLPISSIQHSGTPIVISELIQKMTSKRISDRYQTADEVLIALQKTINAHSHQLFNFENILKNAQTRINKDLEETLAKNKVQQEFTDKNKFLNYSISQLFNQFAQVADEFNEITQIEKVNYRPFIVPQNALASTFVLNYFDRRITIMFYNDDIDNYIKDRKKKNIDFQNEKWGMIIQEYQPDYIEKDKVIIIGKVAMNYNLPSGHNLGFNILLLKNYDQDLYGDWWICKFTDSILFSNVAPGVYYCINTPDIFKEYNYGRRNVTHSRDMRFSRLQNEDITEIISYMPLLK
jgi:eukaryotic-like serine/threonine-protein kinase